MLIFISCTIILDILLTCRFQPLHAPTARSARSFSRSDLRGRAELHIGTNKQMGAWKIGVWLSFCMISSRGCVEIDQISWFLDTSCQFFFVWMPFVAMAFQKLVYKHRGCKHWSSSVFTKWCNWITESPVTLMNQAPGNGSSTSRPWSHQGVITLPTQTKHFYRGNLGEIHQNYHFQHPPVHPWGFPTLPMSFHQLAGHLCQKQLVAAGGSWVCPPRDKQLASTVAEGPKAQMITSFIAYLA